MKFMKAWKGHSFEVVQELGNMTFYSNYYGGAAALLKIQIMEGVSRVKK